MKKYVITYQTSTGLSAVTIAAKTAKIAEIYVSNQFHAHVVSVSVKDKTS